MEGIVTKDKAIKDLVHVIRGQQVMLDSDLAYLYGTDVKKLNQQVRRNIEKFPEDFMFQLTIDEANESLRSHFVTLKKRGSHIKYAPYVFTEQGIYMVATILKNDLATQQSIYIMRSFKEMKHFVAEHSSLLNNTDLLRLSTTVMKNKDDILNMKKIMATKTDINKIMDNFIDGDKIKEKIFLDGQVFDVAEAYVEIYKQAKHHIYIIDDYINIDTLNLLKYKQNNITVTIFTRNKSNRQLTKAEVKKFNEQYPKLFLKYTDKAHDRFIVIDYGMDEERFYVCGASSKDAGQKICTIIRLHDNGSMHLVIEILLKSKDYIF